MKKEANAAIALKKQMMATQAMSPDQLTVVDECDEDDDACDLLGQDFIR